MIEELQRIRDLFRSYRRAEESNAAKSEYPVTTPVFTKHENGMVTVDAFPMEILVHRDFLRHASPMFVRKEGFRSFSISCANDFAAYRALRQGPFPHAYYCERIR